MINKLFSSFLTGLIGIILLGFLISWIFGCTIEPGNTKCGPFGGILDLITIGGLFLLIISVAIFLISYPFMLLARKNTAETIKNHTAENYTPIIEPFDATLEQIQTLKKLVEELDNNRDIAIRLEERGVSPEPYSKWHPELIEYLKEKYKNQLR